jgi:hypothetical protein
VNFIDKMTTHIPEKNPDLAVKIRNWFAVTPAGREFPEGFERLAVEIGALQGRERRERRIFSKSRSNP